MGILGPSNSTFTAFTQGNDNVRYLLVGIGAKTKVRTILNGDSKYEPASGCRSLDNGRLIHSFFLFHHRTTAPANACLVQVMSLNRALVQVLP